MSEAPSKQQSEPLTEPFLFFSTITTPTSRCACFPCSVPKSLTSKVPSSLTTSHHAFCSYEASCKKLLAQYKTLYRSLAREVPDLEVFMTEYHMQCPSAKEANSAPNRIFTRSLTMSFITGDQVRRAVHCEIRDWRKCRGGRHAPCHANGHGHSHSN